MDDPFAELRRNMVERQLLPRGIRDRTVLAAMGKIQRELFLDEGSRQNSYADGPLPIACGQTISQPYIVAYMTELLELRGGESVLEIGSGSGYQTAVLAEIAARVYTVEVIPELSRSAGELLLGRLNYRNVFFRVGRGQEGWAEFAPYDRIQEPLSSLRADLVQLIRTALALRLPAHVIVNNRAEGSAPLTIVAVAKLLIEQMRRSG